MLPTFRSGDSVSVHRASLADVLPGEVVVFARNHHLVVHRVVRRTSGDDGIALVTRGDAQPHEDPPVEASEMLGVVTALHRRGASRAVRLRPTALARGVAWMVRRSDLTRSILNRLNAAIASKVSATSAVPNPAAPTHRGRN